jgi:PTS system beta-glucosides-specific IIC component
MDYQRMAKEILQQLGGSENVISLAHCATRLRLQLKNVKQVEDNSIRAIKGVLGVVRSADQYQIIIGNDVNRVYDAFMNIGSFSANSSEMKKSEQNVFFRVCEAIASVFTPILETVPNFV